LHSAGWRSTRLLRNGAAPFALILGDGAGQVSDYLGLPMDEFRGEVPRMLESEDSLPDPEEAVRVPCSDPRSGARR
jgi:hypothetical protein